MPHEHGRRDTEPSERSTLSPQNLEERGRDSKYRMFVV